MGRQSKYLASLVQDHDKGELRILDSSTERLIKSTLKAVSREFCVPVPLILGPRRWGAVIAARNEVIRRLAAEGLLYKEIAFLFNRHHATIIHALRLDQHPERRRNRRAVTRS